MKFTGKAESEASNEAEKMRGSSNGSSTAIAVQPLGEH